MFVLDRPTTTVQNVTPSHPPIEGTSVTLRCNVEDGKPLDITKLEWKHNDRIMQGQKWEYLTIDSLNKDVDGGQYSCAAENVFGMGTHSDPFDLQIWCKDVIF